jgi:hypothetical protein
MQQVITTILLDGNPKGLRLIEMANWSGKAFIVPRGKIKEFKNRDEAQQPGIYFLFGEGEDRPKVYIGQSENAFERILSHDNNREESEWNTAFIFVGNLDSTFIKFLESITIDFVKKANRYEIFNSASPKENKLSEAQKIIANEYLEKIKVIISLFGYSIFEDPKEQIDNTKLYFFKTENAIASGSLLDSEEFIVYKGSTARVRETPNYQMHNPGLRAKLLANGILVKKNNNSYEFVGDYIFTSPSAAGDTVAGRSVNGWTAWKDKGGKTLDENVRR